MKVETTNELVLKAANENPASRGLLMTMFPSVFEDMMAACEIGAIFFRKDYPNNVYAVIKKNGNEVVVMNVTHSTTWESKQKIKLTELLDSNQQHITIAEFKKLTGYKDLSKFMFVPRGMNVVLNGVAEKMNEAFND